MRMRLSRHALTQSPPVRDNRSLLRMFQREAMIECIVIVAAERINDKH